MISHGLDLPEPIGLDVAWEILERWPIGWVAPQILNLSNRYHVWSNADLGLLVNIGWWMLPYVISPNIGADDSTPDDIAKMGTSDGLATLAYLLDCGWSYNRVNTVAVVPNPAMSPLANKHWSVYAAAWAKIMSNASWLPTIGGSAEQIRLVCRRVNHTCQVWLLDGVERAFCGELSAHTGMKKSRLSNFRHRGVWQYANCLMELSGVSVSGFGVSDAILSPTPEARRV